MKLKFYGTRGSIPICDAGFQQFGGNTTCLQITFTDTNRIAIIDAGTGLRNLGRDLLAIGHKQEQIIMAFTHFHWDHIQGFPFFAPAYEAGQKITFLTLGNEQTVGHLREIFEVQMQSQYFPVQLDRMGAEFEFMEIADASKHFTGINHVETIVTARKPAEPRTFEQAKPEVLAALEAIKRRQATEDFRKSLRNSEAVKIEAIHHTPR